MIIITSSNMSRIKQLLKKKEDKSDAKSVSAVKKQMKTHSFPLANARVP